MVGPLPSLPLFEPPVRPPGLSLAGAPMMVEPVSTCSSENSPIRSISVSSSVSSRSCLRPGRAAARSVCSAIHASMTTGTGSSSRGARTAGRGSCRSSRRISRILWSLRSGSGSGSVIGVGGTTIMLTLARIRLMNSVKAASCSRSSGISSVLARYTVGRGGGGASLSSTRGWATTAAFPGSSTRAPCRCRTAAGRPIRPGDESSSSRSGSLLTERGWKNHFMSGSRVCSALHPALRIAESPAKRAGCHQPVRAR